MVLRIFLRLSVFVTLASVTGCLAQLDGPGTPETAPNVYSLDSSSPPNTAWPSGDRPLDRAHEAYIDGDFETAVSFIQTVLTTGDGPERENAVDLMDAIWNLSEGRLTGLLEIPESVGWLWLGQVTRQEPEGTTHHLVLRGGTDRPGIIRRAQLFSNTRPGQPLRPVLDSATALGTWAEYPGDETQNAHEFELQGDDENTPSPEGLYLMVLELDDGERWEATFVFSDLEAPELPLIRQPLPGEALAGPTPLLQWDQLPATPSPGFSGNHLTIWLASLSQPRLPAPVWTLWTDQAVDRPEVRMGGQDELDEGPYWLSLGRGEIRRYGDLTLARVGRTALPFHVTTAAD